MKKETVKIMKMSKYSYGLVIPKDFMQDLKWKEKQKVSIVLRGKNLTIRDWKNKKLARNA